MPAAVLEKEETSKTTEPRRVYSAPIAIYETGESYLVLAELPGADEKSVQVRMDNGLLTIEATCQFGLPPEATKRYSEICIGDYRRRLDLGEQVATEGIDAVFKGGLLRLTLPKSKGARARKVPVKAG